MQVRNVQLNVKITPCMKLRIIALAKASKLSITELLIRAIDAYASPDVGDRLDNDQVACFFGRQIEVSPGYRLSYAEVWAAFREWCRSHDMQENIRADDFGVTGLLICQIKQIAVRARGNQVFCLDVRLRTRGQHS